MNQLTNPGLCQNKLSTNGDTSKVIGPPDTIMTVDTAQSDDSSPTATTVLTTPTPTNTTISTITMPATSSKVVGVTNSILRPNGVFYTRHGTPIQQKSEKTSLKSSTTNRTLPKSATVSAAVDPALDRSSANPALDRGAGGPTTTTAPLSSPQDEAGTGKKMGKLEAEFKLRWAKQAKAWKTQVERHANRRVEADLEQRTAKLRKLEAAHKCVLAVMASQQATANDDKKKQALEREELSERLNKALKVIADSDSKWQTVVRSLNDAAAQRKKEADRRFLDQVVAHRKELERVSKQTEKSISRRANAKLKKIEGNLKDEYQHLARTKVEDKMNDRLTKLKDKLKEAKQRAKRAQALCEEHVATALAVKKANDAQVLEISNSEAKLRARLLEEEKKLSQEQDKWQIKQQIYHAQLKGLREVQREFSSKLTQLEAQKQTAEIDLGALAAAAQAAKRRFQSERARELTVRRQREQEHNQQKGELRKLVARAEAAAQDAQRTLASERLRHSTELSEARARAVAAEERLEWEAERRQSGLADKLALVDAFLEALRKGYKRRVRRRRLLIRREKVVADLLHKIPKSGGDFLRDFDVSFIGEEGVDQGGLSKDVFTAFYCGLAEQAEEEKQQKKNQEQGVNESVAESTESLADVVMEGKESNVPPSATTPTTKNAPGPGAQPPATEPSVVLLVKGEDGGFLLPSAGAIARVPSAQEDFEALGRILLRSCLVMGLSLPGTLHLSRMLFKLLLLPPDSLNAESMFEDATDALSYLREFDSVQANSLSNLLAAPCEDEVLTVSMFSQNVEGSGLHPDEYVTDKNKATCICLKVFDLLVRCRRPELEAIRSGFNFGGTFSPLLRLFRPEELQNLCCGLQLSADLLWRSVNFSEASTNSKDVTIACPPSTRAFLHTFIRTSTHSRLVDLLYFATALKSIPVGGLKNKINVEGVDAQPESEDQTTPMQKTAVSSSQPKGKGKTRPPLPLPTASTCFNVLRLPDYPDMATFSAKMSMALKSSSSGFHVA